METYKTPKSDIMAEAARKVIPAATISNWRGSIDEHPVYISHGKGARLYDVDGNEYIDYSLSHGPALLGHSNAHLQEALRRQLERLHTPNVSDLEAAAAQKISKHVASAELVTFACAGTEANLGAIRVARAYTGRDKILRFNGHYHGGLDSIMGGVVRDENNPVPEIGQLENDKYSRYSNTLGRYSRAFEESYMIEWNNLPALERFFTRFGKEVAVAICEPVMVNNFGCVPEPGYLEGLRRLCTEFGAVLLFDEVLTGFRMGLKSAQGYFGVIPDMTVLAKAVGAGVPVSAITGRREVMDMVTRAEVVQGGTYSGHPLAMAGVIAAIEEYEKDNGAVYRQIEKTGNLLKQGLEQISRSVGIPLLLQGFPAAWSYTFTPMKKVTNHREGCSQANHRLGGRFSELLLERGVMTTWRLCTSAAHTEKDVQDSLDRMEDALTVMKKEM